MIVKIWREGTFLEIPHFDFINWSTHEEPVITLSKYLHQLRFCQLQENTTNSKWLEQQGNIQAVGVSSGMASPSDLVAAKVLVSFSFCFPTQSVFMCQLHSPFSLAALFMCLSRLHALAEPITMAAVMGFNPH